MPETRHSTHSMATPQVAALAGLVVRLDPSASEDEVKARILKTARDLGPRGYDQKYGRGLIDAGAALR